MSVYIDNFETIFGVKNNIQALRNKVLELATQGKLVEQDPNDEPASELMKKIQVERDKLVKEGKIKKQKPLPPIEEGVMPFEIPVSWKWVRLSNLSEINPRNSLDDELVVSFIPMKLMKDGYGSYHSSENKKWKELKSGYTHFAENDIAIAKITPCFENRKSAILTGLESGFGAGTTEFHIIRTFVDLISRKYLLYLFKTQWFINSGINTFTGTAGQQRIGTAFIEEFTIPLPPLVEQHRIATKIESLMSEIDKLEESLLKKEKLMEMIPKAFVDIISSCQTGEELNEQLQFLIKNFETVFQTPESMQELRKVVLQLAIEGKLVPQDANDEPASELVKRIKTENDTILKKGKMKKQKSLPNIEEDDIPFKIPESWAFEKIGNIFEIQRGSSPRPKGSPIYFTNDKTDFHWITIWDITNNSVGNKVVKTKEYLTLEGSKYSRYVENGEIIIAVSGSTVGKTSILGIDGYIYDGLDVIKNINKFPIFRDYIYLFLQSWKNKINNMSEGSAFPNINTDKLNNLLLPIPPLAEQQRIVSKVESIMSLIDQMENKLKRKADLVEKMASA